MILRTFSASLAVTAIALVVAYLYAGWSGVALCLILAVLEISLSFDNAVINATILGRMSPVWQRVFLTVGVLIAVFGMRLLFPLAIVWATAGLDPVEAMDLALHPPPDGAAYFDAAQTQPSYETLLTDAHPQIAAFGGMFLLMLFGDFVFSDKELHWLRPVERPLARIGAIPNASSIVAIVALVVAAQFAAPDDTASVLTAGVLGLFAYLLVNGLTGLIDSGDDEGSGAAGAVGRAGFFLFLYLEVLDASFSFDGVIGAFAITSDPILIALGLGFVGAMFVRSITVYLVRAGTLAEYRYLEHGAHWAIGALAVIMLVTVDPDVDVPDVVTGLIGVAFIGAATVSSVIANRREAAVDSAG